MANMNWTMWLPYSYIQFNTGIANYLLFETFAVGRVFLGVRLSNIG
jgi:hypothetical protein